MSMYACMYVLNMKKYSDIFYVEYNNVTLRTVMHERIGTHYNSNNFFLILFDHLP